MYIVRVTLGAIILLAGILGLFLPVVPGFALIVFGLFLINAKWMKKQIKNSPIAQKFHAWRKQRKKKRG